MRNSQLQKEPKSQATPFSRGRRSFVGGIATLGAGLAGAIVLPTSAIAKPTPEPPPKAKSKASGCGSSLVVAAVLVTTLLISIWRDAFQCL